MRSAVLAAALAVCVPLAAGARALAHEYKLGSITIERVWARATPTKVGGAYMTLRNGGAIDRLLAVSSPVAEKGEIHETRIEGGMAMMRPVGALELAPGRAVELKPGGMHVMLMGLQRPLTAGETVRLVLTFERAGTIEVEASVEKAGAAGPAHRD